VCTSRLVHPIGFSNRDLIYYALEREGENPGLARIVS
jgi:hypothetical protein